MSYEEPYYSRLASRLVKEHISEMQKEGFHAYMTGGGMMYDVEDISVGFESNRTPTLEEARVLYVRGVERLLNRVNQDLKIRPYLHNYPFTVADLTYMLEFSYVVVDVSGSGPIADVMCVKGKVCYSVYDPANSSTMPVRTIHRESYDEALRIVRESGALKDLFVTP